MCQGTTIFCCFYSTGERVMVRNAVSWLLSILPGFGTNIPLDSVHSDSMC